VDPNIESYAGRLAFEVEDDYDEDEEDEEDEDSDDGIVCYIYTFCCLLIC